MKLDAFSMECSASFNPRAREGRDGWVLAKGATIMPVSIHAPVKGATV
jgi:hypothetical protein